MSRRYQRRRLEPDAMRNNSSAERKNKMEMNYQNLVRLEQKLGHQLLPDHLGSISHLNEVPAELITEARRLNDRILAETLIAFYTTPDDGRYIGRYVQDVVFGETPPQLWRRGRVLVADFSLDEQLCLDSSALLAPIGGDFHLRIAPGYEDWVAGVSSVGAPACPQPDADYRSPLPSGTVGIANPNVEPVSDKAVTIRRWIASRLAAVLKRAGELDSINEPSQITAKLPPYDQWSNDARIAAIALIRERRELKREEREIPGFRGPDAWYQEN
jgi:hypothetical protein